MILSENPMQFIMKKEIIKIISVAIIVLPSFAKKASAQVKTVFFQDSAIVNTAPSKLPLVANFELAEECPGLESNISKFLFEEDNHSLKDAYLHYKERLENTSVVNPKDAKEKVTGRLFDVRKIFEKKGAFVCFEATAFETQLYAGNKSSNSKNCCFMYDIIHNKVLTLDNICTPSTAKYLKSKLNNDLVSVLFIDCGDTGKASSKISEFVKVRKLYMKTAPPALHYGSGYQILTMEIENNRKYFTPEFNEIIDVIFK